MTILYLKYSKVSYLKKITRLEKINIEIDEKQNNLAMIINTLDELRDEYNRKYLKFDKAKNVLASVSGFAAGYVYANDDDSDFVKLAIKNVSKSVSKTILNKVRSASQSELFGEINILEKEAKKIIKSLKLLDRRKHSLKYSVKGHKFWVIVIYLIFLACITEIVFTYII